MSLLASDLPKSIRGGIAAEACWSCFHAGCDLVPRHLACLPDWQNHWNIVEYLHHSHRSYAFKRYHHAVEIGSTRNPQCTFSGYLCQTCNGVQDQYSSPGHRVSTCCMHATDISLNQALHSASCCRHTAVMLTLDCNTLLLCSYHSYAANLPSVNLVDWVAESNEAGALQNATGGCTPRVHKRSCRCRQSAQPSPTSFRWWLHMQPGTKSCEKFVAPCWLRLTSVLAAQEMLQKIGKHR